MAEQIDLIEDTGAEDETIRDEYRVWRKNAAFLYDSVCTHALEWPSLTVQWLPAPAADDSKPFTIQNMLLGTHTSTGEQNHLMIAEVRMPKTDTEVDSRTFDEERGELGGYPGVAARVEIKVRINHDGEVNRARYMPQNPFVVATKTVSSEVYVFDVTKHGSMPAPDSGCSPQHRLQGHDKEGYGLGWSPFHEGKLVSGSDDGKICMWTIGNETPAVVTAERTWTGHSAVVEDVEWHRHNSELFGSVSDDSSLLIWDLRSSSGTVAATQIAGAHAGEVNGISFSPYNEMMVLSGGADCNVKLWDLRNPANPIHVFEGHQSEVFQVQWSLHAESVLASCSADRRVHIWDTSKIGEEQDPEDAEDGPPELLFIHGGHTSKVGCMDWNPDQDWVMASVAEDNILQIWQLAESIYFDEDEEDDAGSEEEEDLEDEEDNAGSEEED